MASVTKGRYAKTTEWAKHLRKWGKKAFWSKERSLAKKDLKKMNDD